ncbi:hypothetical protein NMG60_11026160 [Bertholletia excelsa]
MKTTVDPHVEDQMIFISHHYPEIFTQLVPQPGEAKPRRRRRKNRGEAGGGEAARKRKLSREQVDFLELNFGNEHKLESERKDRLASELGLDPRQVAVWFQNRRARWKIKKLEEEYARLKTDHESAVLEKCRLETEVLKLRQQLSEAEQEIQRLLDGSEGGVSSTSASSSLSVEATVEPPPPLIGDFEMDELGNIFSFPEISLIHGLDWVNVNLYDM